MPIDFEIQQGLLCVVTNLPNLIAVHLGIGALTGSACVLVSNGLARLRVGGPGGPVLLAGVAGTQTC